MLRKIIICWLFFHEVYSEQKQEQFIATKEWQIVQPGQPLPRGLHIRHDFAKKITEAKLLDETETTDENAIIEIKSDDESADQPKDGRFLTEEIAKSIEKIEEGQKAGTDDIVLKKFRTFEQLKKEMGGLNMTIKTDAQLVRELVTRFDNLIKQVGIDNHEEFHSVLTDLEYLTHQIDNALEFIRLEGIEKVVLISLQFTDTALLLDSLRLLQAATQNNPKVQIALYERQIIPVLMKLLNNQHQIQLSTLSVLSSLLQRFPTAQWYFIENKGLHKLHEVVQMEPLSDKFVSRILNIIIDLFQDSQELSKLNNGNNIDAHRVAKFLSSNFNKEGLCEMIAKLVTNLHFNDHDISERTMKLVQYTSRVCPDLIENEGFKKGIKLANKVYFELSESEKLENLDLGNAETYDTEYYFVNLYQLVQNVTNILYGSYSHL